MGTAFLAAFVLGALEDQVSYYEVLTMHNDVHAQHRRSIGDSKPQAGHEIKVKIFNMTLTCHTYPRKDMFSPTFRLVVVRGEEHREVNDFDKEQFLVGSCKGDPESEVRGFFTSIGVFEGTITYNGIVYGIEEAKRHLVERTRGEHHGKMIAYRSSDMIWDQHDKKGLGSSFCGARFVDDQHQHNRREAEIPAPQSRATREKRASQPSDWNTCKVIAVADHKFFHFIGGNDIYSTAAYIGSVMDRVDAIYRSTVFNIGYDIIGMGFEIAEMRIYEQPSSGFNADQNSWEPLKLLQMFGRNLYYTDFCAAHLFTHQQFSGNVLGLAYIASDSQGSAGGICSPTRTIDNHPTALNTGWSTTLNSNGDTVLAQQAQLVTAHELGHNWGAEHDPDTDSCAPSSLFGDGKYLMYAYSVSGSDDNNNRFSECSRRDIAAVLKTKGQQCFSKSKDKDNLCGNGKIDTDEQCDAGYLGRFGLDPCCSQFCRLNNQNACSPYNSECCSKQCQMEAAGVQCVGANEISCQNSSFCTGVSFDCPTPPNKPKGADCLDLGKCDGNGSCKAFCEARGKISCTCDTVSKSCQRCCRDNASSACKPFSGRTYPLPNSRPCVIGYCNNGVCQKSENSLVQRLFSVLEALTIDEILEFFRNNVVGVIIVFSLILWIPFSLIISLKDRQQRRRMKREAFVDLREDMTSMVVQRTHVL